MERDYKTECARLEEIMADRTKDIIYYDRELKTANQALEKMQSQLQQAEGSVKVLSAALEKLSTYYKPGPNLVDEIVKDALSTPTQPSKYDKMLAVVEATRDFFKCSSAPDGNKCIYDCDKEPCAFNKLGEVLAALDAEGV